MVTAVKQEGTSYDAVHEPDVRLAEDTVVSVYGNLQ
jgi:hypothetical protein